MREFRKGRQRIAALRCWRKQIRMGDETVDAKRKRP